MVVENNNNELAVYQIIYCLFPKISLHRTVTIMLHYKITRERNKQLSLAVKFISWMH